MEPKSARGGGGSRSQQKRGAKQKQNNDGGNDGAFSSRRKSEMSEGEDAPQIREGAPIPSSSRNGGGRNPQD